VRFGAAELEVLANVQPIAEEIVGDHFRITSFGPQHHSYEIVTLASGGTSCREPTALAKLCRYDREERAITDGRHVSRFYRVCLQDDAILRHVDDGLDLKAVLLYVLTHELIHIVRFESFQVHCDPAVSVRAREEELVHHMTERVLRALRDDDVDEVVDGLAPGRVDVLVAQR